MRKPWYRKSDDWWYIKEEQPDGKLKNVRLAHGRANEAEANKVWHRRNEVSRPDAYNAKLWVILEAFGKWLVANRAPNTVLWYQRYLEHFDQACGELVAREVKPFHVQQWIDGFRYTDKDGQKRGYNDGAKRAAIVCAKAAYNWAVEQDLLDRNPIAKVRKPPTGRREQLVDPDAHRAIWRQTDKPFKLFLYCLRELGCRPGAIRTVTAANFDERSAAWIFIKHKTDKKTGKRLVIHLTPRVLLISRILAARRPTGALFLNARGEPWTVNAVRCRMRRLRESLGLPEGTVAYSYRHTFTTDAMVNGVDSATVAELLGHRDTRMIDRHYGHLDQRQQHLKDSLKKARG